MNFWFYLFLILLLITIILIVKIFLFEKEIKNIISSLDNIIGTDTNSLITLNFNNRKLKNLVISLNENLKKLRSLELEYKNGNHELKSSITNISHDLKTPLTAIRGYLDLLNKENLSEKECKYLEIIDNKIQDIIDLTSQLVDFSQSLDIFYMKNKKLICVNDVLEDVILSFYALFKKNDIEPRIEICQEKIERILDEIMLRRIFENIISNAIKYGKNDLNIVLSKDGKIKFINKTDQIDKTSLDKIFNRYYTVKNARKPSGIGLAIAKQLVILNGGDIEAKYDKGNLNIEITFNCK